MTVISNVKKSGRGRPRVDAVPVTVRIPPAEIERLDYWIRHQKTLLSRPEAIRRLVELGLTAKSATKPGSASDRDRSAAGAKTVANAAVDRAMKDSAETDEVKGQRKRRLTEMPPHSKRRR